MKPLKVRLCCPQCPPNKGHNADKRYLIDPKAHKTKKDWRHKIKDFKL